MKTPEELRGRDFDLCLVAALVFLLAVLFVPGLADWFAYILANPDPRRPQ